MDMDPLRHGLPGAAHQQTSISRSRSVLRVVNVIGVLASIVCALMLLVISGCRSGDSWRETIANETVDVDIIERKFDHPTAEVHPVAWSGTPVTIRHRADLDTIVYRDMTLDEVLQVAMQNSDVLRELGGTILRNPNEVFSRYTGDLAFTDPRFSPEAALSAFDTQLRASAFFNNNNQLFNNPINGGGTSAFKQDLNEYEVALSKVTATGSQLALRSMSIYNANNSPINTFPSAWDTWMEGEIRKPLLQGGGLQFNRIAGPGGTPGVYNGVLIAKVTADMDQTEFEKAVRNYVNDVTNAYWDLYFSYRDLDARSRAMKRALEAWNRIKTRADNDLESGAAEALAREQYYRLKADVDDAITGRISLGTRTGSGSTGGTLEAAGGVQTTERRLRLLIGLPITDGELVRPAEEPPEVDVIFDWDTIQQAALTRRPELRKQQMAIRRRELEVLAARNFLNPRLDAVGRYRFRGFGHDLIRSNNDGKVPSSAVRNMMGGDQQEWFLGLEYEVPIGYRKAHLAVNHAELRLSRERIIQREQQRKVIHDLTNAVADAARAYESCQNSMNRYLAARELLTAYEVQEDEDLDIDVDHLLDAQRRVVEAEIRYYRNRTEYAVALKNVHLEKGSLLAFHNLHIFDRQPPATAETEVLPKDPSGDEESALTAASADAKLPPPATVQSLLSDQTTAGASEERLGEMIERQKNSSPDSEIQQTSDTRFQSLR